MGRNAPIRRHRELEVYQMAFRAAKQIFEMTKSFPKDDAKYINFPYSAFLTPQHTCSSAPLLFQYVQVVTF